MIGPGKPAWAELPASKAWKRFRWLGHRRIIAGLMVLAAATVRGDVVLSVPTEMGSGVTIKISSPVSAVPHFGFMPAKVTVENLTSREGTWRFRFDAGSLRMFPGTAITTFELSVPPTQTRDAWFYVPLAGPGLTLNPAALTAGATPGPVSLPSAPPVIPGVYPNPNLPGVTWDETRTLPPGPGAVTRVFTITQLGPPALLPPIPTNRLPLRATSNLTPNADGTVTRVTTIPVAVNVGATAGSNPGINPSTLAITNARQELATAGLSLPGTRLSASARVAAGPKAGMQEVTVSLKQTGPASSLPLPPLSSLPKGFTAVNVVPEPGSRDMVIREFTYVETISTLPPGVAPRPAAAPMRSVGPVTPRISGLTTLVNSLTIDTAGPGVPRVSRISFPYSATTTAMGPLATTPALEQVVRGKVSGSGTRAAPNISGFEPAVVPPDWRIWSSFNSALLTSDDFAALDGARRGALRTWVASGGRLFLSPETRSEFRSERIGAGRIEWLAEPIADAAPTEIFSLLQLTNFSPGMPDRDRAIFGPGTAMADVAKFEPAETLWLSLLLIGFAALIGPVNVFWFAPAARRHRLFLTTPLIALGGASAVAVAIVLDDGVGGSGVRRTLVWLVPGENRATVFQEQVARSGFLTWREFGLDDTVVCSVLPLDGNAHVYSPVSRSFVREVGRASGDWFSNRSRQAHLLRAVTPTRARIEIVGRAADGTPTVESTLATELRDFRLRDADGRNWSARVIPTGSRVTLAADGAPPDLDGNGTPNLNDLIREAATLTEPWQWVALGGPTDLAPLSTLPAIRWSDDPIVYAGLAEARGGVGRPSAPPARAGE